MIRIALVAALLCGGTLPAADIEGAIRVTRRLTRQRVVPLAPAYHRGTAVAPAANGDWTLEELDRVAIYLEGPPTLPSAALTVELEQRNRRFQSHTLVIPVGSTVSFPNRDPIFHNVFSLSKTKSFDLGNYRQHETRRVTFQRPGVVQVYCHLHPNMAASIVVAPNRWVTKPSVDGTYALKGVPAGATAVVVWHPSAGTFRKPLPAAASTIDFEIPVDVHEP